MNFRNRVLSVIKSHIFLVICVWAAAIGTAATLGTITQLPDGGGVFTSLNHDTINTNLTNIGTSFTNINAVLGGAGSSPSGSGNLCLTTSCAMTTPTITSPTLVTPALGTPSSGLMTNLTGTPNGAGVTLSVIVPLTLSQLQTLNTVGVQVLAAPGATSMYMMGPCVLNLTRGSAAFTSGGTVSIGYGTQASVTASNSTIASTVFTTFAASHLVVVQPVAQAVTATTSYANLGIWMIAASADFATGTGASGVLSCQYSTVTGIS